MCNDVKLLKGNVGCTMCLVNSEPNNGDKEAGKCVCRQCKMRNLLREIQNIIGTLKNRNEINNRQKVLTTSGNENLFLIYHNT